MSDWRLNLRGPKAYAFISRVSLILGIFAVLIVTYESLTPTLSLPSITHMDKIMHFVAYAGLAGLFTLGCPRIKPILICLSVIGFGALIEILQHIMALGRSGSLLDGLANTGGAIIGTTLAVYLAGQWFLAQD